MSFVLKGPLQRRAYSSLLCVPVRFVRTSNHVFEARQLPFPSVSLAFYPRVPFWPSES